MRVLLCPCAVVLLFVVPAHALVFPSVARRTSLLRCSTDAEPPPLDLDSVCEEARISLREALLQGKRCLTIEAGMAALDATGRGYDPPVFSRFALEISRALTVLEGDLLLLLPGMTAVMETRDLIESGKVWSEEDRERLRVSSIGMTGAPQPGDTPPAAVVIAGLAPSVDSDDASYRDARAWLKSAGVAICINPSVKALPAEMSQAESAYCLMPYTVARTDTWRGDDADLYQEDAGSVVLWRKFPGIWRVLLDTGNSGEWSQLAELEQRPDEAQMSDICLPTMQKRQAALDALSGSSTGGVARAGGGGGGGGGGGAPSAGAASSLSGGSGGASSESDATGGGQLDSSGVVTLSWDQIQAPKAFGPMSLYGAVALHRARVLGSAASYDQERDALGLHVILPAVAEDAAAAWEPAYPKLRGGLKGACHIIMDGAGVEGVASLEQIAIQTDAAPTDAIALLTRALAEASAAGQRAVVCHGGRDEAIMGYLEELGFGAQREEAPSDVADVLPEGGVYKLLGRLAALESVRKAGYEVAEEEPVAADVDVDLTDLCADDESEADDDETDGDEGRGGASDGGGGGSEPPPGPSGGGGGSATLERGEGEEEQASEGRDESTTPGATAEDIARLKRMFGSTD